MITINGVEFGAGVPKICIPIVEKTEKEILQEALKIKEASCDVVEWRIDFFNEVYDYERVLEVLKELKKLFCNKILLVTFRTRQEGGQKDMTPELYQVILEKIIESKNADMVDVELFIGDSIFEGLVKMARSNGCYIIGSNHDFDKTPSCEEIVERLLKMNELGADISKIAVMPNGMEDVSTLLRATAIMKDCHKDVTVVSMSMGQLGMISRITGEIFGSAMTFGILDKPSAPGQIGLEQLQDIMKSINELQGCK